MFLSGKNFIKRTNSSTIAPSETAPSEMTYAPSDLEKRRIENIKRNNEMLRQLGIETVTEDANVKLKQPKKLKKALNSSSSSEDSSSDDDSCDDNSEERNLSTCITSVPVVNADISAVPAKKQVKKIDLTTEDEHAITSFLSLVATTHYDPDNGVKNPDAGVFKVESVVVEHYKSGAEVVVYRCK